MNYEEMFKTLESKGYVVEDPMMFYQGMNEAKFQELISKINTYDTEKGELEQTQELEGLLTGNFYKIAELLSNERTFVESNTEEKLAFQVAFRNINSKYFNFTRIDDSRDEIAKIAEEIAQIKSKIEEIQKNAEMTVAEKHSKYPALFSRISELEKEKAEKESAARRQYDEFVENERALNKNSIELGAPGELPPRGRAQYRDEMLADFNNLRNTIDKLNISKECRKQIMDCYYEMVTAARRLQNRDLTKREVNDKELSELLSSLGIAKTDVKTISKEEVKSEVSSTESKPEEEIKEDKKSEYLIFNGRIGRIPGEKVDFSTLKKGEKYEIESVRNDGKEIKISGIDGWFSRASFWTEKEWEERKTRVIDIDTPEKAEDLTINGIEVDDYVKLSKYGIDHYHDLSATHGSDFKLDTFGEYKVVKITPALEGKQVYITVDVNGKEVEFDSDVFELSRKKYEKKVEVEIGDFVKLNGKKATIPDGSDPFDSIFKTINDPNNDLDPEKDYEVVGISSYNGNKEYTILVDGKEVRYSDEYFDLSRKKELIIKPEEKESPVLDGATHKVDEPPVAASASESFEEVAPPMESFDLDDDEDEIERKPKKRKLITKIEEFGINDFMALQYLKLGVVGTVAALALSGGTLGVIVAAGTVVLTGLRKTQKVSKVLEPIDRTIIKKFTGIVDKIKSTLSKKSSKGESISPDEEDLVSELSGIDKAMKEMETPEKDKDKGMAF